MKATFVDLRTKSAEIIRALLRKERVTVLYRGKPAAVMHPIDDHDKERSTRAKDHPSFGMWADRDDMIDVAGHVRRLRRSRFDAL